MGLTILNKLLLVWQFLIQHIRSNIAFASLTLSADGLAAFLGCSARMGGRICIWISNYHLVVCSLHENILLFILHLLDLLLHVLVVRIDSLPLHELLLFVGVAVWVVGSGPWRWLLRGGLVRSRLLLSCSISLPSWKSLRSILILANMPVLRMSTVLASVLYILILTIIIRLRIHWADILIGVLSRKEPCLSLAFPYVVNHATKFRRRTFTFCKVHQIFEHRFLTLIAELVLAVILKLMVLLLIGESLFELQLLLHFLLFVCQNRMFTRCCLLIIYWIISHRVYLVLLRRILIRLRVHHHHLLVGLWSLHVQLVRRRMHQVVALASDRRPETRRRVVLRAYFGYGHTFVLRISVARIVKVRSVQTVLVQWGDLVGIELLLSGGRCLDHVFETLVVQTLPVRLLGLAGLTLRELAASFPVAVLLFHGVVHLPI